MEPEKTQSISRKDRIKEFRKKCRDMQANKRSVKFYQSLCNSQDHDLVYTMKHNESKMKMSTVDHIKDFRALRIMISKQEV